MNIETHEIEEIKSMLYPHTGHLKFLIKIKNQGVNMEDINNIVEYIRTKPHIIKSLPKDLHSYKSYYSLIKDIYYIENNYELVKFIKNNLIKSVRDIVLNSIKENNDIKEKLFKILENQTLKESFLRWSSKINSIDYLNRYVDIIIDSGFDFKVESKSNIRKLKDYDLDKYYIPMSWCIRRRDDFEHYLFSYDIFLVQDRYGRICGVNLEKGTNKIASVIGEDNRHIYNDHSHFLNEVNKYFIFGSVEEISNGKKEEKEMVIENVKKQSFIDIIKYYWRRMM